MAIKVKHEGSVASRMAASAEGGRAKRAMEAAALVKPTQIQTLQAAHASAPGVAAPHAQLISAPSGGGGGGGAAHAPLIGGGGGIGVHGGGGGGAASRIAGSGGDSGDYKVTGTSYFDRPDDESVWNDQTRQWIRRWLPGEKEAEIQRRVGNVKNTQTRQMFDYQLSAKQKMELQQINDALEDARRSGRYSAEEMAELEKQADEKRMGIKPLPTPREKDAQRSFEERLVTVGGIQGYINAHGDFAPIEKDDGFANFLKAYPKLAEYTEEETITDPATGKAKTVPVTKTRSADEIAKLVTDAQAAWRKARSPAAAQQPASPPPAANGSVSITPVSDPVLAARGGDQPALPAPGSVSITPVSSPAPQPVVAAPPAAAPAAAPTEEDEFAAYRRK